MLDNQWNSFRDWKFKSCSWVKIVHGYKVLVFWKEWVLKGFSILWNPTMYPLIQLRDKLFLLFSLLLRGNKKGARFYRLTEIIRASSVSEIKGAVDLGGRANTWQSDCDQPIRLRAKALAVCGGSIELTGISGCTPYVANLTSKTHLEWVYSLLVRKSTFEG